MTETRSRMQGGTLVAAGMMTMNVTVYAFNVVAAHVVAPQEFGALTALFGIILIGTVAQLGLQAVTARRLAVSPDQRDDIIASAVRVTTLVASAVGLVVALSTLVLTPVLRLDSYWPVILCGATLVPMTVMGTQSGIAQGTTRWGPLTSIYVGNGLGRLVGGTVGLLVSPTPTAGMVGIAIGAWVPVLLGLRLLVGHRDRSVSAERRSSMLREAVGSTHALLAFFVLSNLDSVVARNRFDPHESGLYASGLILAKAAFFLPQFVSVVVFPALARATTHRTRHRAVLLVALAGTIAVIGTAVLSGLALILVGGDQYQEVQGRLWLFSLAGSLLAVVYLLVFDALARHSHGIVVMLWVAVAAVIGSAYGLGVGITGLITTVIVVAGVLATVIGVAPVLARRAASHS